MYIHEFVIQKCNRITAALIAKEIQNKFENRNSN